MLDGYQTALVEDRQRVEMIKRAIAKHAGKDKRFLELGCGTGIFSLFAADLYGEVHAVERDPDLAEKLTPLFAERGNIRFTHEDARTLTLEKGDTYDVIFCEMLNTWLMQELQVDVMNHMVPQALADGGVILPRRVVNLADLGHHDFGRTPPENSLPIPNMPDTKTMTIVTVRQYANDMVFTPKGDTPIECEGELSFKILAGCELNAVRLSSFVDWTDGIASSETKTLMQPAVLPVRNGRAVEAGDTVTLRYSYGNGRTYSYAQFELV